MAPLLLIALAVAQPAAEPREARCLIEQAGEAPWRGPCLFHSEQGSFALLPAPGGSFASGVAQVSVYLTGRGVAEVRGLTPVGINSRWGEARRSTRRPACWEREDFRICAWRAQP